MAASFTLALSLFAARLGAQSLRVPPQRVPVQQGSLTVQLAAPAASAPQFQVLSRGGPALAPVAQTAPLGSVVIPADSSVVVKESRPAPAGPPLPLPKTQTRLPGLLVDSVPAPNNQRDVREWTIYLQALQTPLPWAKDRSAYSTHLQLGLQRSGADGSAPPLDNPVVVQLRATNATVEPERLTLTGSGVEGFREAVLSVADHDVQAVVTATTDLGEQTFSVATGPELAAVDLQSSLTRIVGFGIGTSTLSIVRRAEDGKELRLPDGASIALTSSGGRLQDASLAFAAGASHASTVLRSAGVGDVTVVASVGNVKAPPLAVSFAFPWSYLVAIALGAALGSYVRMRGGEGKFQSAEFLSGASVGVIVAIACVLGATRIVDLPSTALVTEAGCLLFAALGAYGGRALLDRMVAGKTAAPA